MAQQIVNIGTAPNDSAGDTLRATGQKINTNFSEVYLLMTNTIMVAQASDFGTPFVGVVTLAVDTIYMQIADVDMGSVSIKANPTANSVNVIRCINTSGFTLAYSGTGSLFADSELTTSLFCNEMQVSTPNGTVCSIQDTTASGTGTILFFTCQFVLCLGMGTVEDVRFIHFFSQEILCGQGWDWTSCNSITYTHANNLFGLNLASTFVYTLNGANGPISIVGNFFGPQSNEKISNITPSSTTSGGTVNANQFDASSGGELYNPGSKDHSDIDWNYDGNQGGGVQDSSVTAVARVSGNTTETVIPAKFAWVKLAASTFETDLLERSAVGTDGKYTYIGINNSKLSIDGTALVEPSTATKKLAARFLNIHAHDSYVVTFDNTTETVLGIESSIVDGSTITFENTAGTLPVGLRSDVVYFARDVVSGVSCTLSYLDSGAVVPFADNGTGTNSYNDCELVGNFTQNTIAANAPRNLYPEALLFVETGDEGYIILSNLTDSVNIVSSDGYYRVEG